MVDVTDNGSGKITFSNLEDRIFGNISGDINIAAGGAATIQANSVALGTDTTGNYMSGLSAGNLIDITHTPSEGSTATVNVDLSELADGTADVVGSQDEIVYLDNSTQKRKLISEIKLGQFNNDQSWSSTVGTVTSIATAGTINGITLTGGTITTSGTITLGGTLSINNSDWSGTDLAVTNGGTGASDASTARTNLGVAIGSDVQAYDAQLDTISGWSAAQTTTIGNIGTVTTAADKMIYTTAADTFAETSLTSTARTLLDDSSTSAMRTTLGIGTGDSPTFTGLTLTGNLSVAGTIAPESDNDANLGTASLRWADVFAVQTTVGGIFESGLKTKSIGENPTGTIVVWDEDKLIPCDKNEDELVMGVIKKGKDEPIVLGAEPVLVTGKVQVGDYIVTSNKIGHGKSVKRGYLLKKDLFGKVIAQALEKSDDSESCLIKCMIRKF
jgi:hypothetical protein